MARQDRKRSCWTSPKGHHNEPAEVGQMGSLHLVLGGFYNLGPQSLSAKQRVSQESQGEKCSSSESAGTFAAYAHFVHVTEAKMSRLIPMSGPGSPPYSTW
jgi:hypothetical protein